MAVGKKTGGRVKGVPNKASAAKAEAIAASGLTPLDYMLTILRNESAQPADRMWAAEKAAPYVHPKLASVEMNASHDLSDPLAQMLARIAVGGATLVKATDDSPDQG